VSDVNVEEVKARLREQIKWRNEGLGGLGAVQGLMENALGVIERLEKENSEIVTGARWNRVNSDNASLRARLSRLEGAARDAVVRMRGQVEYGGHGNDMAYIAREASVLQAALDQALTEGEAK